MPLAGDNQLQYAEVPDPEGPIRRSAAEPVEKWVKPAKGQARCTSR